MSGRNPAPWILGLTVLIAVAVFVIVGQANPDDVSGQAKGTAVLIVIGAGIVVMVIAQTIWTTRSTRRAELQALQAAAASAGTPTDPCTLDPDGLLIALATVAVDPAQVLAARSTGWNLARGSQRSAAVMTVLVIVLMVPALALQEPRLIVLGAVPIVLYAVVLALRVVRPGGTLDRAYAASDVQLSPLGLQTVARPEITIQPTVPADSAQIRLIGATVFAGERHGRAVEIRTGSGGTQTTVAASVPAFSLAGERQRLSADGPVPDAVASMLATLGPSSHWTSVKLTAGPQGIVVTRRRRGDREWLYDLWLAEHVAALGQ